MTVETPIWVSQLPAILSALAVLVAAVAAAWVSITGKIRDTQVMVEKGNSVTMDTHKAINSRLDEWKREAKEEATVAIVAAHAAGYAMAQVEAGKIAAKVAEATVAAGLIQAAGVETRQTDILNKLKNMVDKDPKVG